MGDGAASATRRRQRSGQVFPSDSLIQFSISVLELIETLTRVVDQSRQIIATKDDRQQTNGYE